MMSGRAHSVRQRSTTRSSSWSIALLSAATGAFSLLQLRSAARESHQLYDELVSGLDLLAGLQFDVQEARRRMLYALDDRRRQPAGPVRRRVPRRRRAHGAAHDEHTGRHLEPADRDPAARQFAPTGEVPPRARRGHRLDPRGADAAAVGETCSRHAGVRSRPRRPPRDAGPVQDGRGVCAATPTSPRPTGRTRRSSSCCCSRSSSRMFGLRMAQRGELLTRERRSQARLFEVIESIDEGMFVLGREGRSWSGTPPPSGCRGRPRDKVLGQTALARLAAARAHRARRHARQLAHRAAAPARRGSPCISPTWKASASWTCAPSRSRTA